MFQTQKTLCETQTEIRLSLLEFPYNLTRDGAVKVQEALKYHKVVHMVHPLYSKSLCEVEVQI